MASGTLVHLAIFASGAVLGAGAVAAVHSRSNHGQVPSTVTTAPQPQRPIDSAEQLRTGAVHGSLDVVKISDVPSAVLKYGNPGPLHDLLVRKAYVAAYDRRLRHPAWTAEHLTLTSLGKSLLEPISPPSESGDRQRSAFTEDEAIPLTFRARLKDYFKSGYDRGHMVPAADAKISQEAMDETFLLSNIAPQVGENFNRHYWAYLEDWCRRLTKSFADVYVFTIPLYLPNKDPDGKWRVKHEVIGTPPNIGVPTHFAKVVLTSRPSSPSTPDTLEVSTGAFVLPNAAIPDETPLESFVVPVESVERAAGLTLFNDFIKTNSKHICKTTTCSVVIRRFDDAQRQSRPPLRRTISAPN